MKVLYLLMRSDLASMNPGKACAQAAHAANKFAHYARKWKGTKQKSFQEWEDESEGQMFGTTIVLDGGSMERISDVIEEIRENLSESLVDTGRVLDPTYPVKDGEVTHLIPVFTCAYVFGEKDVLAPYLSQFELYP